MINLIPPQAKKALVLEYWVRVISVWLILVSIALFVGALLLAPTQVLIGSQISVYVESAEEASKKVLDYEEVSGSLVKASQEARLIINERDLTPISSYVDLFRSLEGQGVLINTIGLNRAETGLSPVGLSGFANDRQALASFRDRLMEHPNVTEVDLPISNLAQDRDISFSLTVKLNNQSL